MIRKTIVYPQSLTGDLYKVGTPQLPTVIEWEEVIKEDGHTSVYNSDVGPALIFINGDSFTTVGGFNMPQARDLVYEELNNGLYTISTRMFYTEIFTQEAAANKLHHVIKPNVQGAFAASIKEAKQVRQRLNLPDSDYRTWDAFRNFVDVNSIYKIHSFQHKIIELWANTLPIPTQVLAAGITPLQYFRYICSRISELRVVDATTIK